MGMKVPEGMWSAINESTKNMTTGQWAIVRDAVEAALRWQKENPPVPTEEQLREVRRRPIGAMSGDDESLSATLTEWVRRMYDEPEVQIENPIDVIQDVLRLSYEDAERLLRAVIRGQKAGPK